MSDPTRRPRTRERAAEASEAAPAPTPAVPSPLAAFLDDAEFALSELRGLDPASGAPGGEHSD